jgi:hypothetical protein
MMGKAKAETLSDNRLLTYEEWNSKWEAMNGIIPQDQKQPMTKDQFIAIKKKEIADQKKQKLRGIAGKIMQGMAAFGESGFQRIGQNAQNMSGFDQKE